MHILLTDETNLKHSDSVTFFAYGGLIIEAARVPELHSKIEATRKEFGYRPGDRLKFDTNARPVSVTVEQATLAKKCVVQACIECECKFIAYVVHHGIAQSNPIDQVIQWGANHVIGKFNFYLQCSNSHGIVAMDRLPDGVEFSYLSDKFTAGLTFDDDPAVALDRIVLFSSTCINASHLSSAMDIVLGAWRYCINAPRNVEAAKEMMGDIAKLIWAVRSGGKLLVHEKGLICRPKEIRSTSFKADYDVMIDGINKLLA